MFLNITKQEFTLDYPIDNSEGHLRVAMHEMFYKVKWLNISDEKKNNFVKRLSNISGQLQSKLTLADGYYGICELEQILGKKFDIRLEHSNANLKATLKFKPENAEYRFARGLAKMLGFKTHSFQVTQKSHTFEGDGPIDFEINSPLYVYLNELDTSKNLFDGKPSTVLKVIPSGRVSFCEHHVSYFKNLQFKKLKNSHIEKMHVAIKDRNGTDVMCDGLFMVLEVVN